MELENSLPHSQAPSTYTYSEPDQLSPCQPIPLLKIHFNIILPLMPRSSKCPISFRTPNQNPVCSSRGPYTYHMSRPSHSSWFDPPNDISWAYKLLIMQYSPLPCYLVPVRHKYLPLRQILETPSTCVPPQCKRQNFTPIHNMWDYSSVCLNPYSLHSRSHRMIANVPWLRSAFNFFLKEDILK